MEWIILIIVIAVIVQAIKYWYITLVLGAIGFGIYLVFHLVNKADEKCAVERYRQEEEKERQEREKEKEAARKAEMNARLQRHIVEQEGYRNEMIILGEESVALFELMPKHLKSAEEFLDRAEADLAEGAFAPFWDSIESAACVLGRFDEGVDSIKYKLSHYTELIRKYEDMSPLFPLARESVAKLGVGTVTAERMKVIVRTAQCNFQFAVIYEQRKTNQILIAGFTSLAHALDQMTRQITASVDNLVDSLDGMILTLDESMSAIHSRIGDITEVTSWHHDELMEEVSELAARENKALEMLDNIQHSRRPFI